VNGVRGQASLVGLDLVQATSAAEPGCTGACAGTDCGPPGAYVPWTPNQVREAKTSN
jgi:hypothetical protein